VDYSALWDEEATEDEVIETYQALIDSGDAWTLEGHVGRTAMGLIEAGVCTLGPTAHRDYWGNVVPGRDEVEPGTKGSAEFGCGAFVTLVVGQLSGCPSTSVHSRTPGGGQNAYGVRFL
jgi:hypothetical protein